MHIPDLSQPKKTPAEQLGRRLYAAFQELMKQPDLTDLKWQDILGGVAWLQATVLMKCMEANGFVVMKGAKTGDGQN